MDKEIRGNEVDNRDKLTQKGENLIKNLLENEKIYRLIEECRSLKKRAYKVENELIELLKDTDLSNV